MLTVLLATRDRALLLEDVLDGYCAVCAPPGGWKLVVVDNGSTDGTQETLRRYQSRLPLAQLKELQAGKNVALNAGLALVDGDLIVLTDDDAFPQPDWLCQLRRAADAQPDYTVFGGMIRPRWERTPSDWLLNWVPSGPTFSLTDTAVPDGPTGPHNVFGPNMAIRTAALADGVRFNESIGPSRNSYAMGSETELVRRLIRMGHKAWFVRDAVVEHFIRKSQMERSWVLERAVRFGRGQYRLALNGGDAGQAAEKWAGIPRYLFKQAALQAGAMFWAALLVNREAWFRARWELNFIRGEMQEARIELRAPKAN